MVNHVEDRPMTKTRTLNVALAAKAALAIFVICLGISFTPNPAFAADPAPTLDASMVVEVETYLETKDAFTITTSAYYGYKGFERWNKKRDAADQLDADDLKEIEAYLKYVGPNGHIVSPTTDGDFGKYLLVDLCRKMSLDADKVQAKLDKMSNWAKFVLNSQLNKSYKEAIWYTAPSYFQQNGAKNAADVTDEQVVKALKGEIPELGKNFRFVVRAYVRTPPFFLQANLVLHSKGYSAGKKADEDKPDELSGKVSAALQTAAEAKRIAESAENDASEALSAAEDAATKAEKALKAGKCDMKACQPPATSPTPVP